MEGGGKKMLAPPGERPVHPALRSPSPALAPSGAGSHLVFLLLHLLHQVKLLGFQLVDPVPQFLGLVPGGTDRPSRTEGWPGPRLREVEGTVQSHTARL